MATTYELTQRGGSIENRFIEYSNTPYREPVVIPEINWQTADEKTINKYWAEREKFWTDIDRKFYNKMAELGVY